jgi:hypothetical protein
VVRLQHRTHQIEQRVHLLVDFLQHAACHRKSAQDLSNHASLGNTAKAE